MFLFISLVEAGEVRSCCREGISGRTAMERGVDPREMYLAEQTMPETAVEDGKTVAVKSSERVQDGDMEERRLS